MDNDENQFKLYFRMAKNLAFNLPDEKDRVKASKWIKKIEETTEASAKRTKFHVIQLLLLSLQRKELVGPFEEEPKDDATLTSYKWCYQPSDISKLILRKEFERIGQPEVKVQMSGDLCEFVAYQEIPNFGTHFFYAFSPEHIQKWTNLDKDIIPKGLLNMTVLSSPDTSILRQSIMETISNRGNTENSPEYLQIKDDMKSKLYPSILDQSCNLISQAEQQFEDVTLKTPAKQRICQPLPETTGGKLYEAIDLEDQLSSNKRSMVAKLPERLKQRLTKKFVPKEQREFPDRDPRIARTPEIFRRDAHKIKHFRKYKPDEFLLSKDEKFRPAYEAFRDLEYMAPENARRSPCKKYLPKPCQAENDKTQVQDLDDSQNVEDSFERSFKRMQEERQQRQVQEHVRPVKRNELIERLDQLKANQAKRIVFDDIDVDIETEEIAFDRFVYKELPEDKEDITILDNTEMLYDDIFGKDQICDIDVLPSPRAIQELEQAEILLDAEMQLDDIFGEDQIAYPEAVFKDVSIEGERIVLPKSGSPERGGYRIGKRLVALPGEEPIVQTYIEQTGNDKLYNESLLRNQDNTPPLDDSMINKVLDEKLKRYRPGENAVPRTYGPWATKFNDDIEKLERGENLEIEEHKDISYLSDTEMETDDLFDERHITVQGGLPSPIIQQQSRKATQQFHNLRAQYERTKSKRKKQVIDQDLLEPYIYGTVPPDKRGLLDTSIENSGKLVPPLLKKISVCAKDPFESFEKQLDQSLQYFKEDSAQCTDTNQGQRVFLDSDFLNKRIEGDLPADDSIIADDEMVFDDFSEIEEYIPVKDVLNQYDHERNLPDSGTSGMEEMLQNLSSQSSDICPPEVLPDAIDRSPGQRLRQTLDVVNKYRMKGSQKLPPEYEVPYTQLENESFPLSSDSESLDITPKSDLDLWDTGKMNEMEKRLDCLRHEAATHTQKLGIPHSPIQCDTPTREIVKKSNMASEDVDRLRKRYKILQQKQLNSQEQSKYAGTFQCPLPFLVNEVPHSEIDDIGDLFDISENGESDVCDVSQRYDPVLKQYIPAQKLEDVSIPEADFLGDEILQPELVNSIYHSANSPNRGESDSSDVQRHQPQPCYETPHRVPDVLARRRLSYGATRQGETSQETSRRDHTCGTRRKLVYEMLSHPECSQLPLNVSPRERIQLLIEQQPNVEVTVEPKKSEFSPLKFNTKHVPKRPCQIEEESFPDECPPGHMYEDMGELAHALYIPTKAEECEIEDFHKSQRMLAIPPGLQQSPPKQKLQRSNVRDASPIGRTDVLPHEEGFKWLPNYMPFEKQVGADRLTMRPQRIDTGSLQPQSRPDQSQCRPPQPQTRPPQTQSRQKQYQQQQRPQRKVQRISQKQAPQQRQREMHKKTSCASVNEQCQQQYPQDHRQRILGERQNLRQGQRYIPKRAPSTSVNQKAHPEGQRQRIFNSRQGPQQGQRELVNQQCEQPQLGAQRQRIFSQTQGPQRGQRDMPKKTSSASVNQKQDLQELKVRQRQNQQKIQNQIVSKNPKLPTTAKFEIVSQKLKDKETIMKKSETVTKKAEPPKIQRTPFEPKRKQKLECTKSGNIAVGKPQTSTYTRKITSGAVGQCGRSLVEKSSVTVTKDYGKKSRKIVKASEVKYNNAKEQRTKEYTFASRK